MHSRHVGTQRPAPGNEDQPGETAGLCAEQPHISGSVRPAIVLTSESKQEGRGISVETYANLIGVDLIDLCVSISMFIYIFISIYRSVCVCISMFFTCHIIQELLRKPMVSLSF